MTAVISVARAEGEFLVGGIVHAATAPSAAAVRFSCGGPYSFFIGGSLGMDGWGRMCASSSGAVLSVQNARVVPRVRYMGELWDYSLAGMQNRQAGRQLHSVDDRKDSEARNGML